MEEIQTLWKDVQCKQTASSSMCQPPVRLPRDALHIQVHMWVCVCHTHLFIQMETREHTMFDLFIAVWWQRLELLHRSSTVDPPQFGNSCIIFCCMKVHFTEGGSPDTGTPGEGSAFSTLSALLGGIHTGVRISGAWFEGSGWNNEGGRSKTVTYYNLIMLFLHVKHF